jgi:TolB protein
VNVDGTNIQFLTEGNSPSWSPDGQSLVFIRRNMEMDPYGDILVIGADGKNSHQLTKSIRANWPSWSPDGRRIAFLGSLPNGNNSGLYLMNADGSGLEFLNDNLDSPPSWSPDGSQILFTEKGRVYTMDVESLQITPVAVLPPNLYYTFVLPQPQ